MKKYFAKCLPVEGEIREGDRYKCSGSDGIHICSKSIVLRDGKPDGYILSTSLWSAPLQRVKLFLCSRNIRVGDELVDSKGIKMSVKSEEHLSKLTILISSGEVGKVMGEISPEATWVGEGDDFDEYEWKKEEGFFETLRILIKGPCGHFH